MSALPLKSIASSAQAGRIGGDKNPNVFAVCRLMSSETLNLAAHSHQLTMPVLRWASVGSQGYGGDR